MAKRLTTGRHEVGMLSDIRDVAEMVGEDVLSFPVEWFIEGEQAKSAKRPDVIIRRVDGNGEVIVSGAAKRPETKRLT